VILIDGSHGEGGGQILRTSLTLACLTKQTVRITNIRAGRPNPGLRAQHLMAARSIQKVCPGKMNDEKIGSQNLLFEPGKKILPGKYNLDIGTAGSVTLVAQTIMPLLLFAKEKSELKITGGTHVLKSPSFDYFKYVFINALHWIGFKGIDAKMERPGYYPKGGGAMTIHINPEENRPKKISQWANQKTGARIQISRLPIHIAKREENVFIQKGIENVHINNQNALNNGNAITYFDGFLGSYKLGKIGISATELANESIDDIRAQKKQGINVDRYLADQLLIYGILGNGLEYISSVTKHLLTNTKVINDFIPNSVELKIYNENNENNNENDNTIRVRTQQPK